MQKVVKHATDSKHRSMLESHHSMLYSMLYCGHIVSLSLQNNDHRSVNRHQTLSVRNEYIVDARSLQNCSKKRRAL